MELLSGETQAGGSKTARFRIMANMLLFLVGQVMKATKGKANPKLVNQILTQKLTGE